ncbi:hypothetical protein, partial [[Flexibacter] sp. ATCC 35208]|uniref:hypothetical protein n=1 Tax=[Flexibacter] sp. ATCC 35208 TaxID=1936242 RepID=UPI0015C3E0F9
KCKQLRYKKGNPHRDCRKFIIVAEGVREDDYSSYFNRLTPRVEIKINNAKRCDKHKEHYFPELNVTKVYILGNQLLEFLGNNWQV